VASKLRTPHAQRRTPNAERPDSAIPVALTIAGSDSSAGAGAQADLKTFSAFGVYGLTAITCVVAETPGKVVRIQDLDAEIVREQLDVVFESFPIAAIKTGLLHSSAIISAIAQTLAGRAGKTPLVIDPIMIATSGAPLLQPDAIARYETELFPLANLITPNLDEATKLLGRPVVGIEEMRAAGVALVEKYRVPVLLKGGHLRGDRAIDLLFSNGKIIEFAAPFTRGVATHGTGCTYSAAITAGLARGHALEEAITRAKKFVSATIAQHHSWKTQSGDVIHALNHSANES
jgi:hydroxymethylpyrimidine/phosphomethylpyrimidine kinase